MQLLEHEHGNAFVVHGGKKRSRDVIGLRSTATKFVVKRIEIRLAHGDLIRTLRLTWEFETRSILRCCFCVAYFLNNKR